MSDNLKLWKSVETTDASHTKEATVSGQKRTTIKSIFQKEKATKIFGVQGIKWGVVVGSESYERITYGDEVLLQYIAVMFFYYDGERGEIPIASSVKECGVVLRGKPNQYVKIDDEAIKKVRTSAMSKGLSELGFNADVFKGLYDVQGYSDYASSITSEEIEAENEKAEIEKAEAYAKWKISELDIYKHLTTVRAVTTAHTSQVRKATKYGDKNGIKVFTEAKENRIEELKCQASTN